MNKLPLLLLIFTTTLANAQSNLADLAARAVSADPAIAQTAQDQLRAQGPEGMKALSTYADQVLAEEKEGQANAGFQARLKTAFNRVGAQYDNDVTRLYWYTDLDQAKAAAKATGRPILSLRLLGRLDQDLSCANSRFFRTTLYPQVAVSSLLRDKFILHWESVRPVPIVTIDFGDGRKLQRTITGNSIHYVLDADGKILDALPGLYSAKVFVHELQQDVQDLQPNVVDSNSATPANNAAHLLAIQERLNQAWAHDLTAIHAGVTLTGTDPATNATLLEHSTTDAQWQAIAQLHLPETTFDPTASAVINRKFPNAATASMLTTSKLAVESPLLRALRNLRESVTLDTVRNNYLLRGKILAYIGSAYGQAQPLASVNDWVYSQVFLTPKQDPWLGLSPDDTFTGIDAAGQIKPPAPSLSQSQTAPSPSLLIKE